LDTYFDLDYSLSLITTMDDNLVGYLHGSKYNTYVDTQFMRSESAVHNESQDLDQYHGSRWPNWKFCSEF
jgi:hypothetical protein